MLEALAQAVASASRGEFWTASGIAGCVACFSLITAWRSLAHKRLIEDMPTTRLRAAAQGYVELTGTARLFPGEPIVSPLTGQPCCWYRYAVERREHGHDRRERTRWVRVEGGESAQLFQLDDDTGRCAVDPEGATVTPSASHVWFGHTRVPPRRRAVGRASRWFGGMGRAYRYREEIIEIGSPLYALGFLRTHGGAALPADITADAGALLRDWKADPAALLARYDRDGNGAIDVDEWEHARRDAHAEITARRATRDAAPPAVDVLSRPPVAGQPYLLAARHEQDLTEHQARVGFASLLVGCGSVIGLLWAVATRLGSTV